jgi:protein O-GlcNAc transferase
VAKQLLSFMATVAEVFALAVQQHQAGNLPQAERLYQQILQADPCHADSHHLLGIVAYQTGRFDAAIASIRQALALNPGAAPYHSNLGLVHEAAGQIAEAVASFQRALLFQSDLVEAHGNLGNALFRQGQNAQAVAHYQQALRLRPDYAEAHCGLGMALLEQGKTDEAAVHFRRAVNLNPQFASAHNNLANMLVKQGKLNEAETHCRHALGIRPDFPEAHACLGNVLQRRGLWDEAEKHYYEALRLKPDFPEAHTCLGTALLGQGKVEQAATHYVQALQMRPDYAEAYNDLGNALGRLGRVNEAISCYQQALKLKPDLPLAHYNFGNALERAARLDDAIHHYRQAIRLKPDLAAAYNNLGSVFLRQGLFDHAWTAFQDALRIDPQLATAQSNRLFCLNYDPQADPDAVFEEYCRWGRLQVPATPSLPYTNDPDPGRILRIGYVSPDFRQHALRRYFEPVLVHHNRGRVRVICYAEVSRPDAATTLLQQLADDWRWTVDLTDAQLFQQIRNDQIDILIDLAGHSGNNRLGVFALKPAPIQATWLGYLNTTGLSSVDYRLTDEFLDPPSTEVGSPRKVRDTEELFRLPGGMCCFAKPADEPAVAPLPALEHGFLTFGSLHNLFKINSHVLDLWTEVLKAVPTARLLMMRDSLNGSAQDRIRREFAQRGIANDRLDLRQGPGNERYLEVYHEIDVSLDTFPCTGGVTTCESLWMGVPVLSLCGVRPMARNSAALLSRVGVADWVVHTPEQYVAFAERLDSQLDQLAQLRAGLRERVVRTLCDAERFTDVLEDAYRTMWYRWCSKASSEIRSKHGSPS